MAGFRGTRSTESPTWHSMGHGLPMVINWPAVIEQCDSCCPGDKYDAVPSDASRSTRQTLQYPYDYVRVPSACTRMKDSRYKEQGAAKWPACTCTVAYTQSIILLVRVPGVWRNRADAATRQRQPGQISSFGADFAQLGMGLVAVCHLTMFTKGGQHQRAGWRVGLLAIEGRTGSPLDMEGTMHLCLANGSSTGHFVQDRDRTPKRRIAASGFKSSTAVNQLLRDKLPAASLLWPSSLSLPGPEAPCRNRRCADTLVCRYYGYSGLQPTDTSTIHATSRIGRASLSGNEVPIERSPNKSCSHNAS
ncbi:hypothetical protein TgHK011_002049 [Trichoderma gracile]|nr:hypothetical protein TgHK011_002049 [Trichoderma gracile]